MKPEDCVPPGYKHILTDQVLRLPNEPAVYVMSLRRKEDGELFLMLVHEYEQDGQKRYGSILHQTNKWMSMMERIKSHVMIVWEAQKE